MSLKSVMCGGNSAVRNWFDNFDTNFMKPSISCTAGADPKASIGERHNPETHLIRPQPKCIFAMLLIHLNKIYFI